MKKILTINNAIMYPRKTRNSKMVETARMLRNPLIICGILASLLYIGTDILAGMLWKGYSFTDQAISELLAIDAPTSGLVVPLFTLYDLLLVAFALGVWLT